MPIDITEFRVEDHTGEIIANLAVQVDLALRSVGETAERYAKEQCPVDTGRLRNSIAYATNTMYSSGGGRDVPTGTPEKGAAYIGSNVQYAPKQEFGDYHHNVGNKHFLRNAAADHTAHYKAIITAALKAGT